MNPPSELKLIIQPKVIDHLGIKMYQKPVDVVSEYIANAWDADSETAAVEFVDVSIKISDTGSGMTFVQCQNSFLTVARDRRKATGKEESEKKGRPILGRKGIGKFAGFGVAKKVIVKTISEENGELTEFEMDIEKILAADAKDDSNKIIDVANYEGPDEARKDQHGTVVTLEGVDIPSDKNLFAQELSRRFLLSQIGDDFKITLDSNPVPDEFFNGLEYVFPQALTGEEIAKIDGYIGIDEHGWARELFEGHEIKWRVGFYEDTIDTEELRGISIYVKNKIAQKPFFFDIVGGISGQFGIEYMTGQVKLDFIDEGNNDLISTERQRINLQTPTGKIIKAWGIERIKFLSSIWKKRRAEARTKELDDRLGEFKARLDALPPEEFRTVKSVLLKIASFERLGKARFQEWCNAILTSWEIGTLRDLIKRISNEADLDQEKFLDILAEADVLTALNIAESVKTKIVTIGELKQRVQSGQLENKVRDYIYEHPWIIHPKWESFKKERSVANMIKDAGIALLNAVEIFNGRVDLALSAGEQLLLVEFMRPRVELDSDHLHRIDDYVSTIRIKLANETGHTLKKLDTAYVIADFTRDNALVSHLITDLREKGIEVMSWNTLIEQALKQWGEHLKLLKERNPDDKRIQDL